MSKSIVFAIVLAALVAGAVMGGFSVAGAVDSATPSPAAVAAPCGMNRADCADAAACDSAGKAACGSDSSACGTGACPSAQ